MIRSSGYNQDIDIEFYIDSREKLCMYLEGVGFIAVYNFISQYVSFPFFFVNIALVVDTLPFVNIIMFPIDLKIV